MARRALAIGTVLGAVLVGGAVVMELSRPQQPAAGEPPAASTAPSSKRARPPASPSTPSRPGASASPSDSPRPPPPMAIPVLDPGVAASWIAAASGATPELNQVSIEQDIALAAEVLGPGGRVLFGSGPDTPTVQVLGEHLEPDPVRLALGDLFAPRGGRELRYRPTVLSGVEPATAEAVLGALDHALAGSAEPLLLYLAGHGNIGEQPRHNTISLWAQSALDVATLAAHLDTSPRPVRLVVTTCFSGGFAEVVFRGADEALGAAGGPRCGLFAAPWDLEATGCDPNPDRAAQQGYGLHLLNALRGRDRLARPLPRAALDLDGDGAISLLEAHTRVRIASSTADVPTTTAERWLRHAAPARGPSAPVALPEEDAVVEALGRRLGLEGEEAMAHLELQRLGDDIEVVLRELQDAQRQEEDAYRRAAAELLARWPTLDDPWHPDQARVLERERGAIAEHLERSARYAAYLDARDEVERLGVRLWDLRRRSAPYERLSRALDNRALAGRLKAAGGESWAVFERILACERGVP